MAGQVKRHIPRQVVTRDIKVPAVLYDAHRKGWAWRQSAKHHNTSVDKTYIVSPWARISSDSSMPLPVEAQQGLGDARMAKAKHIIPKWLEGISSGSLDASLLGGILLFFTSPAVMGPDILELRK